MDTKVFGARSQFYREQADITQTELAAIIGCTSQYVGAIEQGVKTPRLETFVALF